MALLCSSPRGHRQPLLAPPPLVGQLLHTMVADKGPAPLNILRPTATVTCVWLGLNLRTHGRPSSAQEQLPFSSPLSCFFSSFSFSLPRSSYVPSHRCPASLPPLAIITRMDSPLRTYLRDAPRKFDYNLSDQAQREITSELYASLWDNNDELLHSYFPHFVEVRQNGLGALLTDSVDDEYSPTARGHPCGHTFKMGEGVFRCR